MKTRKSNDVQKNSNFIGKDGFLYNIYVGSQTVNTLQAVSEELEGLTSQLRKNKKPILVFTDIRKLGSISLKTRMYAVEMIKNIDFNKVAIFGNPDAAKKLVNFIIIASGRGFKTKYFNDEKEAKEWLLGI